ncbi:hypothetical protein IFM89_039580 [Coptis chinensis]|uniref:Uncharacterized protein n=1 Tax=Coptis chinensis TaxID=261450 RepID=A0A835GT82_9MAGN|nr:hypothetical protein IFM89_039580 [Coptis chinensis]
MAASAHAHVLTSLVFLSVLYARLNRSSGSTPTITRYFRCPFQQIQPGNKRKQLKHGATSALDVPSKAGKFMGRSITGQSSGTNTPVTDSKKHRALDLMKIGVDSVTLNVGDCLQNGELDLMEDDCFYGSSESSSLNPHAYPVAPEHTWVEVSGILSNLVEAGKKTESGTSVVQIAKERGIKVE